MDPMNLIDPQNSNPYIIAICSPLHKNHKYYIHVEKHLISVSNLINLVFNNLLEKKLLVSFLHTNSLLIIS